MLTTEELTACVESRRAPLTGMAMSILGDPSEAEDVVQEAAVSALIGAPRFRSEADVCTWFQKICVNASYQALRRRSSRTNLEEAARREALWRDPNYTVDPETVAVAAENREGIRTAMSRLSPEQRIVIVLHDIEGWKAREIAEELAIPLATAKSHLRRGRQALVTLLAEAR